MVVFNEAGDDGGKRTAGTLSLKAKFGKAGGLRNHSGE